MDAAPQAHHLPVAMETNSKGNYGEAVALVHLCPYVSLYKVSDYAHCVVSEHWADTCVCACVCMHLNMRLLTFVVGGVINGKISIPDDGQLHRKAAHLHPIIEILSPWQPEWIREREIF